jgi:aspartyl-tRNA(Asn)/glutamyl-tRNA(Gln) amidotransferase subunit A
VNQPVAEAHRTILEVGELLRKRKLSPVELTRDCLARIEKLNPTLNAFITVTAESALAQARQAEKEIRQGQWRGPLHGIPIALKDIIDTAGTRTTAASALFKDRIPAEDAEVVRRLKDAGAVLLGKQNLHEFAYGGSSVVSYYGAVHNAWNPAHIPGGSSGGSATSVAAGLCYGAIGTDTGGSVREPAALCGVAGLKPTFGRVSTRGIIPLAPSLDHVGPITRTVADAAVILQAIAGYDAKDPNSADMPAGDYVAALHEKPKPARIGIPRKFFYEGLHPEVASAVEQALGVLKTMAAGMREVERAVPTDVTLLTGEAYAYHAEFVARSPELYQPETLRRIRTGAIMTAADLVERRRELQQARLEIRKVFESVDVLLTPTTPIPAPSIAELTQNPDLLRPREILLLRNTRPINIWGLPAISVPCGFTSAGLPIGLQIIGPHWGEATVLQIAHAYEQATAWHKRQPQLA